MSEAAPQTDVQRQTMEVDIACVGFGPAMGGFLTTLSRALTDDHGAPLVESRVMPGIPPQVICYERADDISYGVSGVVTRARAIRLSFPDLDPAAIPMTTHVGKEKVVHLLDPLGASRRSKPLRLVERALRPALRAHAFELPHIPSFLAKHQGLVTSIGQFNQWVGSNVMASGTVQIWPGTPVSAPLIEEGAVVGIRLSDQGTDRKGTPEAGYLPGMDIRADLTVVGDGPVGPVGRQLDQHFGLPPGHHQREWALGMKMVVDLPEECGLAPGTVLHTLGYPEPEIFGFLYVYPDRVASLGIFIPSWLDCPVRTGYRYLQHWMRHPYLWKHLNGGSLRSWGAKSVQESGKRGEPFLVGDGYARIGEGSGSTNVLTGSGVDEAWATGVMLAEGVLELLHSRQPFSRENLERVYVDRRRSSRLEKDSRGSARARDGFQKGMLRGLTGMALTGVTRGSLYWPGKSKRTHERIPTLEEYYSGHIPAGEIEQIRQRCTAAGNPLHDALMERMGWPQIEHDGRLLVSHQDALLLGGKVQAPPGYADHVVFVDPETCRSCATKTCIEMCSGQAITANPEDGVPLFDREKCVHCGACLWNCSKPHPSDPERTNIEFTAGAGGFHSAEN